MSRCGLSTPDFTKLPRVPKDPPRRRDYCLRDLLRSEPVVVLVVHRDADNAGSDARRNEILDAVASCSVAQEAIPGVPIRMTESWLLLDEAAIRQRAGNPRGRQPIPLPPPGEVERIGNPKERLQRCLLEAAAATGRRRREVRQRFNSHRRELLNGLDPAGPVSRLRGWREMVDEIDKVAARLGR
ncbi:hypothetical protein [Actinoalloteichus caeruleus]|uniref:hypothetical protein n=1 Tax=Actinoalloteichus cyanogriseus TaxID=2893586 RepID=UPI000B108788|nr:hypothetical protein [Actinoalloteichus caeruleus]